jgi:hypothetical protein
MRLRLRVVVLLAAAAAVATAATGFARGAGGDADGAAAPVALRTISGRISAVDAPGRRVTVVTATDGTVVLEFDRNTNVYLEERLGTVRDLVAGARVRASFGTARRAYWIEIRAPRNEAPAADACAVPCG